MRRTALVLPLILAVAAATASDCEPSQDSSQERSEVRIRQESDVVTKSGTSEAVQQIVVKQSERHGITFARDPYCDPDVRISVDDGSASGTVTCIGRTEDRQRVTAVFQGLVSMSSCAGSLTVRIDEETVFVTSNLSSCGAGDIGN